MWLKGCLCIFAMIAGFASVSAGEDPEVVGVFGLNPVGPNTVVAAWVPLETGEAICGIKWFNNDSETVFPAIHAVAGYPDAPEQLADAVTLTQNVVGSASAWSTCSLPVPVASASEGLYILFQLPAGEERTAEGEGGGPGIGYMTGVRECRCWISYDGAHWNATDPAYQLALQKISCSTKGSEALLLQPPNPEKHQAEAGRTAASITCSPNPFNPVIRISYTTSVRGRADVSVYDLRGRKVRTLVFEEMPGGTHEAKWFGRDDGGRSMASGCYFVRLETVDQVLTRRVTLVR